MQFYRIRGPQVWGDLGNVLIAGTAWNEDEDELLSIKRTGPFVPPISISWMHIIVTSDFRGIMERTFTDLQFRPVKKVKIVELHWEDWPWDEDPREWPAGPDPEDYIELRPHSEEVSRQVGDLWELKMEIGAQSTLVESADADIKSPHE